MEKQFTEEQMIAVLRCSIKGFYEWLKSEDCFIQDKNTQEKLENAEISSTRKSIVKNYIVPELEKEGLKFSYKDEHKLTNRP